MNADDREWRDERAAIMEYLGGLPRAEAERRADLEVAHRIRVRNFAASVRQPTLPGMPAAGPTVED